MTLSTDPFPTLAELPMIDSSVLDPNHVDAHSAARRRAIADGHGEGYRQGFAEGRAAGDADARGDLAFALTALHRAVEDLNRRDALGTANMIGEAVDLALAIAQTVIGRELEVAIDPGRDALVRALELAPDRGAVLARFHPIDIELLVDVEQITAGREVHLIADHSVERGGCILDVGAARIDAQIGTALERVRESLTSTDLTGELETLLNEEMQP